MDLRNKYHLYLRKRVGHVITTFASIDENIGNARSTTKKQREITGPSEKIIMLPPALGFYMAIINSPEVTVELSKALANHAMSA